MMQQIRIQSDKEARTGAMRFNKGQAGFFFTGEDCFWLHGILKDYLSLAPTALEVALVTEAVKRIEEVWSGAIQE